jgi:hypothetical protein
MNLEEVESYKTKKALVSSGIIPMNATIRQEFIKRGKPDCIEKHGPYLYAYWKDNNNRLRKKYVGKSWEDYKLRTKARVYGIPYNEYRKSEFITNQANNGNQLAKDYFEKLHRKKVSVDWAYRRIRHKIIDDRLQKILESETAPVQRVKERNRHLSISS